MDVQYYGFTILLVWLQMAGLSAALAPRFGSWALGRSCGVLVVVMGSFLIEHFIGLGSLKAVWFFSSALAAWYLWKHWAHLRTSGFVMGEMIFSFALLYGLIWKYAFPNIYPSAERLT
ncbi:MAG: hypothetical protein K0S28_1471, partial [Paucimonas sp.]|nr:hypothetical protein [Paucimonas sp.]